ncbi:MAG TPA: MgtC/SapB family protein [Myxococcota bacterium]
MEQFDPLARPFWDMIGMALLCGAIVGVERQLRGKPAGVRTSILICVSTAVFIHLGDVAAGASGDPVRVLGQLVTGVGFLGAGVIMAREGTVTGVTTAAVIWVLAAIGAAIGLGLYPGALVLAFLTVGVLTGVELLESSLRWLARGIYEKD